MDSAVRRFGPAAGATWTPVHGMLVHCEETTGFTDRKPVARLTTAPESERLTRCRRARGRAPVSGRFFTRLFTYAARIALSVHETSRKIGTRLDEDKGGRHLQNRLFPFGPAVQACRYAGLQKPVGRVRTGTLAARQSRYACVRRK